MYLVKYALTGGIEEVELAATRGDGEYVRIKERSHGIYKLGRDVCETKEEAISIADAMRLKKVASLKKSLAKYEKLRFDA